MHRREINVLANGQDSNWATGEPLENSGAVASNETQPPESREKLPTPGRPIARAEGQLPGVAANWRSRPLPAVQASQKIASPTTFQGTADVDRRVCEVTKSPKAAAHGLVVQPASKPIECPLVKDRTCAHDPLLPFDPRAPRDVSGRSRGRPTHGRQRLCCH